MESFWGRKTCPGDAPGSSRGWKNRILNTSPLKHPKVNFTVEASVEARFRRLSTDLDASIDPAALAAKVCAGLTEDATAEQLSELMAETAAYQGSMHPDFGRLAARVAVEVLHSRTSAELMPVLRAMRDHMHGEEAAPLVSEELVLAAESMAE